MIRIRVQAVIFNDKGALLLVKHSKNNKEYYVLPGGGVEYGERLVDALLRELKEELDISNVYSVKYVGIRDFIPPEGDRHVIDIYYYVVADLSDIKLSENDGIIKGFDFISIRDLDKILVYPSADYLKDLIKEAIGEFLRVD
ncbi:MAG: NUDIX hydrolase [Spirochaetia bacterium]|nr:NUDIX hydrolase [Spirochaetota bacterium]MCX8096427.1 NUDIX hydrolase [Spirochaetota bacterium]MDW8112769.1 NUDIX hydrolase [Spirochaetia bacterium]